MIMAIAVALLALTLLSTLVGWMIARQWPATNDLPRHQPALKPTRDAARRRYDNLRDVEGRPEGGDR
jgi:hypothetical protein